MEKFIKKPGASTIIRGVIMAAEDIRQRCKTSYSRRWQYTLLAGLLAKQFSFTRSGFDRYSTRSHV